MKLPGLIDPHVHMREPGATYKEDWDSGTAAALAGGFTLVLAMPNTDPPVVGADNLHQALEAAGRKARCDYAQYLGAGPYNAHQLPSLASKSAGLKIYLNQTYGPLRLDHLHLWMDHFAAWPKAHPIVVHAEGVTMAASILLSAFYDRPVHIAHLSTREEILLVRKAKERGLKVTCEVTPHHLFLSEEDIPDLGPGRAEVRPRLAKLSDQQALWENLVVIDCFATDHAPHTIEEKDGPNPPPGLPGLETALPLLLTAVKAGRLSMEDLIARMHTHPSRIFHLPVREETWVEVDTEARYEIRAQDAFTRCAWSPFEGWRVSGKVRQVVLRGQLAYLDGVLHAPPGFGGNVRPK